MRCGAGGASPTDPPAALILGAFVARIRNMKAGYEGALEGFEWLLGTAEENVKSMDKEISGAVNELIDALGEVEAKEAVLGFLRRVREDAEARQKLLGLIEGFLEGDP